MTCESRLIQVELALAGLFPPEVAVAVERVGGQPEAALWPVERDVIARAVTSRRQEFTAGRVAARRCLSALALPEVAVPMGPDRAPIWPSGLFGSISHAAGFAVAVLSRSGPIGVDLDASTPIEPDLWPLICTEEELRSLPKADAGHQVRRIFVAKEAIFKAQAPERRSVFGFDAVTLTLGEFQFAGRFLRDVSSFPMGQQVQGHLAFLPGLVFAGVGL